MPEEQAFCVLLKLMYDYGLREFYKDGFETVYLKLFQLNKIMEVSLIKKTATNFIVFKIGNKF